MKSMKFHVSAQRLSRFAVSSLVILFFAGTLSAQDTSRQYKQTNLVSNISGLAKVTDANLVNPWGLSRSSGSPWWVADNGTGLSTLYDGSGNIQKLVVTVPASDPKTGIGNPTGTVFNGSADFELTPGKPAVFLFATEDGTVSGWNPQVNPTVAVVKVNTKGKSVFKGMAIATVPNCLFVDSCNFLYVADFHRGRIQVFDTHFHNIRNMEERFEDERIPEGFAPFNVQNIGGNLYVAFAKQDDAKHDEVDGAGLGYVDVFSPTGRLLRRLQHGPWFNAPWGLALASGDFGAFTHDVLVGQFGSGEILAFDPVTGNFKGRLLDATNHTIQIEGLWALSFGNDAQAGLATALYFTAGIHHEQDGLFGSITATNSPKGNGQ
jgi:uncharacterized protein (TIGR03118 family)